MAVTRLQVFLSFDVSRFCCEKRWEGKMMLMKDEDKYKKRNP